MLVQRVGWLALGWETLIIALFMCEEDHMCHAFITSFTHLDF